MKNEVCTYKDFEKEKLYLEMLHLDQWLVVLSRYIAKENDRLSNWVDIWKNVVQLRYYDLIAPTSVYVSQF